MRGQVHLNHDGVGILFAGNCSSLDLIRAQATGLKPQVGTTPHTLPLVGATGHPSSAAVSANLFQMGGGGIERRHPSVEDWL